MAEAPKEPKGMLLSPEAVMQVRETVRRVAAEYWNGMTPRGRGGYQAREYYAYTLDNIPAATDASTDPGTGSVVLLGIDPETREFNTQQDTVEVVNRFLRIDIPANTLCTVKFLHGEWMFATADCPISASGGWDALGTSTYQDLLGVAYEQVTGLSITIPQNEPAGIIFTWQIVLRVTNPGNQSATIETNAGFNGAVPTEADLDSRILPSGADLEITLGGTRAFSSAVSAGDTIDIWCRSPDAGGQSQATLRGDLDQHSLFIVRPDQ